MSDDPRVERIRERLQFHLGDTHDDIRYFRAGGMSWLYRARHQTTETERVIKVLRPVSGDTESDRTRFLGEAKVVAGLHHPAICRLWQVGTDPDAELTWMELAYVDGEDLRERLLRGRLSLDEGLNLAEALTGALAVVHDEGLIHRDLKPANVLLDRRGHPYVTDFGLARRPQDPRLTQVGTVAGTPLYMSPEQQRGGDLDARSDVFSLGCILYEAFTGVHPFGGVQPYLDDPTANVPPPRFVVDMPDELDRLLCDMLAFDPDRRPASAREVLHRIQVILGKAPAGGPSSAQSGASFSLGQSPRRRTGLILGTVALFAVIAVVALVWLGRAGTATVRTLDPAVVPPVEEMARSDHPPAVVDDTRDAPATDPADTPEETSPADTPEETSPDETGQSDPDDTPGAADSPGRTSPGDAAGDSPGTRPEDSPALPGSAASRDVIVRIDIDGLPAGDSGLEPILFVDGDRRGYLRMVSLHAVPGTTVRLEPRKRGVTYHPTSIVLTIPASGDTLVAGFRASRH